MRPSRRARVLIAGGGIGGLTTAIALARRGIDSTLLERTGFGEQSGAGIQLGPNATRILRDLGLLAALEPFAFRPGALNLRDAATGAVLTSMTLGRAIQDRYGAPYLTFHRADLHAGLLAAARAADAVELREGFAVTAIKPLEGGIAARSTDGAETDGSGLIGADGLWSAVRKLVAPHAVLRFAHATAWRALLPRAGLPPPFDGPDVGLWLGPRSHLVHYPVRGGDEVNIVAVIEGGEAKQGWNVAASAGDLLPAFRRWASPVRELLAGVEAWRCWSLYRLPRLRHWTEGRVTLLGDAAHPVLPYLAQGGGLAIEDAASLAANLEACHGDPPAAFRAYEKQRRHRAFRVQAQSARFGHLYHLRGRLASARNAVLKRRSPEALLKGFDWLYASER